jgi:hypothetical protein
MVICSTLIVTGGAGGLNVNIIVVTQDDLKQPYMRTVAVSGTGNGNFNINEGNSVIASGVMTNGWGMIDIYNISQGTHTFCATPSSAGACTTFTVGPALPIDKWGCSDYCENPHVTGDYSSQQECKASCVEIIPETASHVIKFALASNPYIGYIQQSMVTIGADIENVLPFNPNVQYVRTELDTAGGTIDVYVKYTGMASSARMGLNGRITSMTITDDLTQFALDLVLILSAIVAAATVSLIISTGGWSVPIVAKAVLAGSVIFMLGFTVYNLGTKYIEAKQEITKLEGYKNATITKDQANITLDEAYDKSAKTPADCLILLKGKQAVGLTYADTFSTKFSEMDLKVAKTVFTACSTSIINTFNAGSISCDTARANIMVCQDGLFNTTDTEFNIKVDPVAPVSKKCPADCFICDPITTDKCIISNTTVELIGLGILGFFYLSSRPRETVVIKGG